ncbi:MAG: hypothetical protein IJR07_02685 [Bacteroidaceae bacterium]|nr:hypothetical protein [Bacteroidaceae bacterium]
MILQIIVKQAETDCLYAGLRSLPIPTVCFTIKSAHAVIEEQGIYVAIFVENRNPLIQQITDYFDKAAASLTDNKPK